VLLLWGLGGSGVSIDMKDEGIKFVVKPIGVIRSPFRTKEEAPIQGRFRPDAVGFVEIYEEYQEGLKDIEGFTHIFLIYPFDRAGRVELVRPVLLDDEPHGIFACRYPARPNCLGLTVVELLDRDTSGRLTVGGIDVLDGTPLLDIKPYVARFDSFPHATEGWFKDKHDRRKPPGRE